MSLIQLTRSRRMPALAFWPGLAIPDVPAVWLNRATRRIAREGRP